MKCCNRELPNPEIIEGTAYFVCPECGMVREKRNYQTYAIDECFSLFQEKYGFVLPNEYVDFSNSKKTMVVKLPPCNNKLLEYYFGDGFYEIGTVASLDPNSEESIYHFVSSGREWGLPNSYVPIEGDGHTWLALDFSCSPAEPKVVVTETDAGNSLIVANSFNEFLSSLLEYEEVYDIDGNIIYKEKAT